MVIGSRRYCNAARCEEAQRQGDVNGRTEHSSELEMDSLARSVPENTKEPSCCPSAFLSGERTMAYIGHDVDIAGSRW